MKNILRKIAILFFLFFTSITYSQSSVSHEVGILFGPASFQTDFGQRHDFPSANQSTLAVGVSHYLKFFGNQYNWRSGTSFFSEHFKLKTEFTYLFNTNIKHEGDYVKGTGATAEKLKAMTGQIKMYNIGTNLEFYFLRIDDYTSFFGNKKSINPYISVGLQFSMFDPDIFVDGTSLAGQEEPYTQLIDKWQNDAIYLEKGNTFGVSAGAGVRFSLDTFDLVIDSRWQHFFSDKVDGLDDFSSDSGSDFNDTMVFINIGAVYVFKDF
jgi:hypothetical protein